jgi:hypothetical protein
MGPKKEWSPSVRALYERIQADKKKPRIARSLTNTDDQEDGDEDLVPLDKIFEEQKRSELPAKKLKEVQRVSSSSAAKKRSQGPVRTRKARREANLKALREARDEFLARKIAPTWEQVAELASEKLHYTVRGVLHFMANSLTDDEKTELKLRRRGESVQEYRTRLGL